MGEDTVNREIKYSSTQRRLHSGTDEYVFFLASHPRSTYFASVKYE
jgi:hypothetical protein